MRLQNWECTGHVSVRYIGRHVKKSVNSLHKEQEINEVYITIAEAFGELLYSVTWKLALVKWYRPFTLSIRRFYQIFSKHFESHDKTFKSHSGLSKFHLLTADI